MVKTIEEVVEQLKRDPSHPVRARLGGLTVEVRAVAELPAAKSAADLFAEIGPWPARLPRRFSPSWLMRDTEGDGEPCPSCEVRS